MARSPARRIVLRIMTGTLVAGALVTAAAAQSVPAVANGKKARLPRDVVLAWNEVLLDANGNVRPRIVRHFDTLDEATWENAMSRIYLGIHWIFDAELGVASGEAIADYVTDHALLPRRGKKR